MINFLDTTHLHINLRFRMKIAQPCHIVPSEAKNIKKR